MNNNMLKRIDKPTAVVLALMSVGLVAALMMNDGFMGWAFARHHNQLSWYIRPLFLVPFCFFAYVRSWTGIAATVLAVLSSMFWFPAPEVIDPRVAEFLKMEQDYLSGNWDATKILLTTLVPVSMSVLALAFWKRSLWLGIAVLVFIAAAKMLWSVAFGGDSGRAVIVPAIMALVVCIVLVWFGFHRLQKRNR